VSARPRHGAAAAALALGVAGCAYFNGMYNANRFTHQAQGDERAGRMADAQASWQQAAEHAESLIVHHPKSGWAARAFLVRGRALVHLGAYSDAEVALQQARRRRLSAEDHLEALELLGRAQLVFRQLDSAGIALDSAAASRSRAVRDEALLYRGRVWAAQGNLDSARASLTRSRHPQAAYALAAVDLQLGDTAAAGAVYDSLAGVRAFPEAAWRAALDSLAAAGAREHASRLAERLAARRGLSAGSVARLLLDDAQRRIAAGDTAGAVAAWKEADAVARDSVEGQNAEVALALVALAQAPSDSALGREQEHLNAIARTGGTAASQAAAAARLLARVDSLAADTSAPDAHWFERGELLRDSLHASALAAQDFALMAVRFPASPWTPKAIVAAIAAGAPGADSLRALLERRYRDSPYTISALGGAGPAQAYADLEDSLHTLLAVAGTREEDESRSGGRVGRRRTVGDAAIFRERDAQPPRRGVPTTGEDEPEAGRGAPPAARAVSGAPAAATPRPGAVPAGPPPRPPYGPPGPEPPE
jgi:tetratricopeptide (TPR) repeat protein